MSAHDWAVIAATVVLNAEILFALHLFMRNLVGDPHQDAMDVLRKRRHLVDSLLPTTDPRLSATGSEMP